MYLKKSEYEDYKTYIKDKNTGKILTPRGLKMICDSCDNDPYKIGEYILKALTEMEVSKI